MILRWRDIHDQPDGLDLEASIQFPNLVKENPQIVAMDPVQVKMHAQINQDTLTLEGTLQTRVTYACSRCLAEHEDELSTEFFLEFVRTAAENLDEEDERLPFTGDQIELDPYLEQELLLAIPYTPVCKEECAGLCPECGVNRNENRCECRTDRIDPRLADLAKLLDQED